MLGCFGWAKKERKRGMRPASIFFFLLCFSFFPTGILEKGRVRKQTKATLIYQNNYLPVVYLFDKTKVGRVLFFDKN